MPKKPEVYSFTHDNGSFHVSNAVGLSSLYFPLANEEGLLSAITPALQGDIKLDQHSFLTVPMAREDLHLSRAGRNFWLNLKQVKKTIPWAVNGRSVWQRSLDEGAETVELEAGLLWHRVKRANKKLGLEVQVTSFAPSRGKTFEVMNVEIKNTGKASLSFTATSAIPLYGRSADNLRDHRHVTSLLNRISQNPFGLQLTPTMSFNERGHTVNATSYYIGGLDAEGKGPTGFYPTIRSFVGNAGDLERPEALHGNHPSFKTIEDAHQGQETMGALQFNALELKPGNSTHYTLILGIDTTGEEKLETLIKSVDTAKKVKQVLEETKKDWDEKVSQVVFETGNEKFNKWIRWTTAQPIFRKLFGNSFLPDFDYGRGGRGWRDLWQDCLALLLADSSAVRPMLIQNFGGVRIDGSNATIIGRKKGAHGWEPEFIADRNNITRTWMDHGIWPLVTTQLYLNQTGDWDFLLEKAPYFSDGLHYRGKRVPANGKERTPYEGTVLEHLLVQTVVQFFNVGDHNIIRLEDADWNDGLDMARERGESVAFTCQYGGNLNALADLLEEGANHFGWTQVAVAEELVQLLDRTATRVNYESEEAKRARLADYFKATVHGFKGTHVSIPVKSLINDLREKANWIKDQVNKNEFIEVDQNKWYNGYYDNEGKQLEGKDKKGRTQMTLTGQVFPLMSGVAEESQINHVIAAVNAALKDSKTGGIRLNTDFGVSHHNLGRSFSFAFGEKENGAVFSHMVVMYAYALYSRGFGSEAYRVLNSLYAMAHESGNSRQFPGLPEYFSNDGQGHYHYLTGSASWYVLTLLTQAFGVRGQAGDLALAPKLHPDQFDRKNQAKVQFTFAGSRISLTFSNPKRVPYEKSRVVSVKSSDGEIPFSRKSDREVVVQRVMLKQQPTWTLTVEIDERGNS